MKRSALWTLAVVVLALIVVVLVVALGGKDDDKTVDTTTTTQETTTPPPSANEPTGSIDNNSTNTQSGAAAVQISNFSFDPVKLTVKKGTTVTWTNKDSVSHTVTPDNGEATDEFKDSGLIANGETFSITFNTNGTFSYHCTPHPQMKASVTVID